MIKKQIAKLIDVKSIISIAAAVVFVVLALTNVLTSENVMVILTMVFQFYFGYQLGKKVGSNVENQ